MMEQVELQKDLAGQLFRRYGILFREILHKEQDLLKWPDLFKRL